MSRKPLEVLKTSVSQLKAQIKAHKNRLLAKLSNHKQISSNDKTWLDKKGAKQSSRKRLMGVMTQMTTPSLQRSHLVTRHCLQP